MKALIVGGGSGLGLALSLELLESCEHIYIVQRHAPDASAIPPEARAAFEERTSFHALDLNAERFELFDTLCDIDILLITAGFGRVAPFESLTDTEIRNLVRCNELGVMRIVRRYYDRLRSERPFYCGVLTSIAGHVASPLFSVYGAAKAGAAAFIENVNAELAVSGSPNRILDVAPGALKGTAFSGGKNEPEKLKNTASEIVARMLGRETLYIPQYEEVYRDVIERYRSDPEGFARQSYAYKVEGGRIDTKPQTVIGFLSGTFDLFHIGHLNLLRRAKAQCDYLIVSVHGSGAWKGKKTFIPYEERRDIVASCRYVDEVVRDYLEDSEAWEDLHFDRLFVGSDYKGTPRFMRYEEFFRDKGVEIVYFPYTQGTSSTELRDGLAALNKG